MRRCSRVLVLTGCALASACVVRLDHEFDDAGPATADAARDAPILADGSSLWIFDGATGANGAPVESPAFSVGAAARSECATWTATFLGPSVGSTGPDGPVLAPLDLVATDEGPALYYERFDRDSSAPLGLRARGVGLARRDPTTGAFVPTADLLWSADRPAYGVSALREGSSIHVWGCTATAALSADCFVARVDAASPSSSAAYTYWAGDHWSSSPDDAVPIARGGASVSVRRDPSGTYRYLMTYVPVLGTTLVARTAIAPEGPWSAPVTLGSCALAGAGSGAFCSGAQQHPELVPPGTYAARTFGGDAATVAANGTDEPSRDSNRGAHQEMG